LIAAAPPQAELQGGLDLGRSDRAGQGEHAVFLTAFHHGAGQAGGDHEAGTSGHGLVDLRHGEHGARTDQYVAAGRHRPDGVLCGRRPEGHLRHRQTAGDQRAGQSIGVGRVIQDDDGDKACGAQG
jgi:hypothetical protein